MIGLGKERLPNIITWYYSLVSCLFIGKLFNYYLFVITLSGTYAYC